MKTSTLKYNITKQTDDYRISVKISLSDDCRNGHADFAITGDYSGKGGSSCGCIHDKIHKFFPQFQPFIDLHLSDAKGAPMYAQGNGFYHLRNSSREMTMSYLRITDAEYDRFFREAEDQLYFTYLLQTMNIPFRWEEEARAAIKQLEELTGYTFIDSSERYQFTPLTPEEFQLIEARIAEGYYTPANIRKRKVAAELKAKRDKIQKLYHRALQAKDKIARDLQVHLYILKSGMPDENFIYYDHTNTGVFNWMNSSCYKKITQQEFNDFLCRVNYQKLPTGIKFELKAA